MNIVQTKQIAIVDFLLAIGIRPVRETASSAWYHAPYREDGTPSFKVNKNRNIWFDFATAQNGDIIDLAVLVYRTHDISRILKMIEQATPATPIKVRNYLPQDRETASATFRDLHMEVLTSTPLLSYLLKRGIDPDIARQACKEAHYTCHGKPYFAIAFPNVAGGFEIRNPYYKGCIAPKDVSWIPSGQGSDAVCLFEGFMDCLSYLTMQRQGRLQTDGHPDLLVLNSVNNLPKVLARLKTYRRLYCYLDNDDAGRRVVEILREVKGKCVYNMMEPYPLYKDLNDLLMGKMKMP